MSSFFSSLANKAQTAYEQSPLSGQVSQLQSKLQGGSSASEHPTTTKPGAQGGAGGKSQVLGNITYQFRSLQMQYANVPPVQKIITSEKGVVLDFESVAKDAKFQSKELYMWGQTQDADLKDVTDRLGYLNFVQGALSASLASRLDSSRSSLKALRDAEKALEPRRNNRLGLQTQIARLEHDMQKGSEKRLSDFKEQLKKLEAEDESAEKEIELLKRRALRESESEKWAALREYGEKLVLLAEASTSIIEALPSVPPSESRPYTGAESTAATRASLQHALDNFKPGSIGHSFQPSSADIKRSESRSFGVTHAAELQGITPPGLHAEASAQAEAPASQTSPAKSPDASAYPPPVNPTALNTAPAPIPSKPSPSNTKDSETTSIPSSVAPAPSVITNTSASPVDAKTAPIQVPEPTVAETGVPVTAGPDGPGPASGSLKDLKAASPPSAPAPGNTPKFESAEEEKARLAREERERLTQTSAAARPSASTPKYESAEEEKKRLEREERERLLKEEQGKQGGSGNKYADDEGSTPPPYQEL